MVVQIHKKKKSYFKLQSWIKHNSNSTIPKESTSSNNSVKCRVKFLIMHNSCSPHKILYGDQYKVLNGGYKILNEAIKNS